MKRTITLLFVLSLHLVLFAQHRQVKIAGSVGVANVNISVLNTRYGTSSDAGGRYELLLFDRTKPVDLLYTCIGYRDTVVSLTPRMLQHDSVGISFVMRRTDYDLQEVGVSASRDFYRTGTGTSIADIGFLGDRVLVLEQRKGKSELVVVSLEGEREAQCAFDSLYESIHVDCLGDCILVGGAALLPGVFRRRKQSGAVQDLSDHPVQRKTVELRGGFRRRIGVQGPECEHQQVLCQERPQQDTTLFLCQKRGSYA